MNDENERNNSNDSAPLRQGYGGQAADSRS